MFNTYLLVSGVLSILLGFVGMVIMLVKYLRGDYKDDSEFSRYCAKLDEEHTQKEK